MFDYKLIEALALVIEEGGFERAARVLCITQSAVSQRLRQLEDGCGQVLLTRGSPPEPTSAGRNLLKHYRQVRLLEEELGTDLKRGTQPRRTTLAIGINADSLASWFMDAARTLLEQDFLLDLRVEDQIQTDQLLRDGEVAGCISTEVAPIKGCKVTPLMTTHYRMLGTPEFLQRWFPEGFTLAAAETAPAVIFNRQDRLHHHYCEQILGDCPNHFPAHYIPSREELLGMISAGFGYGMVPDWDSADQLASGQLVELAPDQPQRVKLYWHCWNLESEALQELTEQLVKVTASLAP